MLVPQSHGMQQFMDDDIWIHARSSVTRFQIDLGSSTMISNVGIASLSFFVSNIDVISFFGSLNEAYTSVVLNDYHCSKNHFHFSCRKRPRDNVGYLVVVVFIFGPPFVGRSRRKSICCSVTELQQVPKLANIRSIVAEDVYPRALENSHDLNQKLVF